MVKTLIIAEIGSVHDGSFGNALKLIDTAAECGTDAVKFQTHIAAAETLPNAPMPPYFKGEPRFEYFERTSFSLEQWQALKAHCDEQGLLFLSSPFSAEAVDLLEQVGMTQYKIPSGEVTNLPLIEKIAALNKPIILSSGMSSWAELDRAVEVVQHYHHQLAILQCTSEYPCPYERVGLNVMQDMAKRYALPVGLSDHTLTAYAPLAAVTLGASIIEKHLTFSRRMYGSDARTAMQPEEFKAMVEGIRAIEIMLNHNVDKDDLSDLRVMKETFEKSLVALVDIPEGAVLSEAMVGYKKPGSGIASHRLSEFLGRQTRRFIPQNTLLHEDDFSI